MQDNLPTSTGESRISEPSTKYDGFCRKKNIIVSGSRQVMPRRPWHSMKRPWHAFLRRHRFLGDDWCGARVWMSLGGSFLSLKKTKKYRIQGPKDDFFVEPLDSNYLYKKKSSEILGYRISVIICCDLCVFLLAVEWLRPVSNKTLSKFIWSTSFKMAEPWPGQQIIQLIQGLEVVNSTKIARSFLTAGTMIRFNSNVKNKGG